MEPLSNKEVEKFLIRNDLTPRDLEVLKYLIENRFITSHLLKNKFFNGKETNSHFRRMRRLRKKRLVEPLMGDGGNRLGYRARSSAVKLLTQMGITFSGLDNLSATYKSSYNHDRVLIDLRGVFEQSPLVRNFRPEHIVRSEMAIRYGHEESEGSGYKVPDATFTLRTSKGDFNVALELEMAVKTKDRYRKALRQLSVSSDWDLVLLIIEDENRIPLLKGILSDLRLNDFGIKTSKRVNSIYFASLGDVQTKKLNAVIDGEKKCFTFNQLREEMNL